MESNFKRCCPNCGATIEYASKYTFAYANNNKSLCQKCCRIGAVCTNECKEKIRSALKGVSLEMRFGKDKSDELKNHISLAQKGISFEDKFGKEKSDSIKAKLSKVKLGIPKSIEARKRMSEARKGKSLSEDTKKKIGEANKGTFEKKYGKEKADILKKKNRDRMRGNQPPHTGKTYEEFYGIEKATKIKNKMSLKQSGCHNANYGKTSPRKGKTYNEIFGNTKANELVIKHRESLINKSYEDLHGKEKALELKKKMRILKLADLSIRYQNGNQIMPNYNPKGCQYFNLLMEQTNTFIQHAENGGEYHIKELGYFVDGYDADNNIVYEFDEPHHFNNDGVLKSKDINRQREITDFLKCQFIRIKYQQNEV